MGFNPGGFYLHSLGELEREVMAVCEQDSGGSARVTHDSHIAGTDSRITSPIQNDGGPNQTAWAPPNWLN